VALLVLVAGTATFEGVEFSEVVNQQRVRLLKARVIYVPPAELKPNGCLRRLTNSAPAFWPVAVSVAVPGVVYHRQPVEISFLPAATCYSLALGG
jgi:hypothetical protein